MMVMKPKVCLFVRAGLYRGSRGFWKRPYGRPEGPNRYGTLAKLKAMVRISKSRSPPQPRKRRRWEEHSSREDGPVVEKRQGRHSAARVAKEQGRESCRDLWCCSGEDKSKGGVGGASTVMESAVTKTSQARLRRSQARVREGGRQREGALWHSATEAARERLQELVQFSSVAI